MDRLKSADFQVFNSIEQELHRQQNTLEMIASENFTSPMVLEAVGSVLTKTSPGKEPKNYLKQNMPTFSLIRDHRQTWAYILRCCSLVIW